MRPVSVVPAASFAVAVSWVVLSSSTVPGLGATVIVAIGTLLTVTVATPCTPPTVALIVAVPVPTAVIVLLAVAFDVLTVATAGALDDHVTGRPVSVLPEASFAVAVTACVCPTLRLAEAGASVTFATGTLVTVTVVWAITPSTVACTTVDPDAIAVTRPDALIDAIVEFATAHPMLRPIGDSGAPLTSARSAVSC